MTEIQIEMPVKGVPITGSNRTWLSQWLRAQYEEGQSVRSLAAHINRSYANTHRLLKESGVTFRRRGGNTRGRK